MAEIYFGKINDFKKEFNNLADLKVYLKKQREKWVSYFDNLASNEATQWKSTITSRNNDLDTAIKGYFEQFGDLTNDFIIRIEPLLQQYLEIIYDSLAGEVLRQNFDNGDYIGAANVYSYFQSIANGVAYYFEAGLKYELARAGIKKNTFWDAKKSIDNKIKALNKKLLDIQNKEKEIDLSFITIQASNKSDYENLFDESENKLKEIEKIYNEKLVLEAPRKYWSKKKDFHNRRHLLLIFILLFFITAMSFFVFIFNDQYYTLLKNAETFIENGFKPDSSLEIEKIVIYVRVSLLIFSSIFLSTLFFWPIRHIVRMIISEDHLRSDARYKDSLIVTYLALHKKGAILEKDDRQIALNAIFKQPQDGLIKDDGMPSWTPSSWFNKPPGTGF